MLLQAQASFHTQWDDVVVENLIWHVYHMLLHAKLSVEHLSQEYTSTSMHRFPRILPRSRLEMRRKGESSAISSQSTTYQLTFG
jgi:hypothetical protein